MVFVLDVLLVLLIVSVAIIVARFTDRVRKKIVNQMSFRETMDLCDLPIVTFVNNGKKLNFLLDTGASISVINSGAMEGLSFKNTNRKGDIYGMDGVKHEISFVEMTLNYRGKEYKDEFQVLDLSTAFGNLKSDHGVNLHGILSSTFFQKYKYVLDFSELVFYSIV